MRILLSVDGSSYSYITAKTLVALGLPTQDEITVMTVIPEHSFLGGITIDKMRGATGTKKESQEEAAIKLLSGPVQLLGDSGLKAESLVRWGNPAQEILRVAEERDVSLIVMGAKGLTNYPAFHLGSVSQKVMKHARVSVLLARKKTVRASRGPQPDETNITIDRVLFATDGSRYADTAAQFLLDLPLPQQSQVIVVTVQSGVATLHRASSFDAVDVDNKKLIAHLQAAEEKEAQKILARSSQQFEAKGYKTIPLSLKGAAGELILKAAGDHDPDIIAVGSRGLSGIESFFLGSVSDGIARHAPCSVLIVKPPKR